MIKYVPTFTTHITLKFLNALHSNQVCNLLLHQEPVGGSPGGGITGGNVRRILGGEHVPRWGNRASGALDDDGKRPYPLGERKRKVGWTMLEDL